MLRLWLVALVFMLGVSPASAQVDIDISQHPDREFLEGYEWDYSDSCKTAWQRDNRGIERIVSVGDCEYVTEESELEYIAERIKHIRLNSGSRYSNYQEYLDAIKKGDPYVSMPREHWGYMLGYKYEYGNGCEIGWEFKSATFHSKGDCSFLTIEKIIEDALKSIEYAKANSNARNFHEYYSSLDVRPQQSTQYSQFDAMRDAKEIWRRACIDAKELRPANPNQLADNFPGIDRTHALRLIHNAWQTVTGLGGMVNCAEQGHYVVEMYASDIDIRSKNRD